MKHRCRINFLQMSSQQCEYAVTCGRVELLRPPYWSSYSKPRLWLHTVVSSKYFDLGIAAVIGVNVFTMAIEHYNMPTVISLFILHI